MQRLVRNTKGMTLIELALVLGIGVVMIVAVATLFNNAQASYEQNYALTPVEPSTPEEIDALIERYGAKAPAEGVAEPERFLSSNLAQWDIAADLPRDAATDHQVSLGGGALGHLEFGDTDAYWLEMASAGEVVITLDGVDQGIGAAGDPDLIIQAASGEIVERGSSDGGERIVTSLDAGRYLVQAKLYGAQTGHYELRVAGPESR